MGTKILMERVAENTWITGGLHKDNSNDRKTPKYWLRDDLRSELEKISTEVDYDAMSTVFGSISAFEEEVRLYKKDAFRPIIKTIN